MLHLYMLLQRPSPPFHHHDSPSLQAPAATNPPAAEHSVDCLHFLPSHFPPSQCPDHHYHSHSVCDRANRHFSVPMYNSPLRRQRPQFLAQCNYLLRPLELRRQPKQGRRRRRRRMRPRLREPALESTRSGSLPCSAHAGSQGESVWFQERGWQERLVSREGLGFMGLGV